MSSEVLALLNCRERCSCLFIVPTVLKQPNYIFRVFTFANKFFYMLHLMLQCHTGLLLYLKSPGSILLPQTIK